MSEQDFTTVWNSYSELFQGYLASRTKSNDDAEDLFQELFIRFYKQTQKESVIENIKPWLYRVAKNLLTDYYRKTGYKSEVPLDHTLPDETDLSFLLDVKKTYEGLDVMLKDLSVEYQEILLGTDIPGITVGEYACKKSIPLNTAKSKLRRARIALRERLLACCDFHFDTQGNLIDYTKK